MSIEDKCSDYEPDVWNGDLYDRMSELHGYIIDDDDYMYTECNFTTKVEAWNEITQIFSGWVACVAHCHRHNVTLNDTKLENLMYSKGTDKDRTVKLVDFGGAEYEYERRTDNFGVYTKAEVHKWVTEQGEDNSRVEIYWKGMTPVCCKRLKRPSGWLTHPKSFRGPMVDTFHVVYDMLRILHGDKSDVLKWFKNFGTMRYVVRRQQLVRRSEQDMAKEIVQLKRTIDGRAVSDLYSEVLTPDHMRVLVELCQEQFDQLYQQYILLLTQEELEAIRDVMQDGRKSSR